MTQAHFAIRLEYAELVAHIKAIADKINGVESALLCKRIHSRRKADLAVYGRRVFDYSEYFDIYFKRQKETKGLADAIYRAKSFVGDEPFAILYGDDVIDAEYPVTKQLIDVYEKYNKGIVGVKEVDEESITKYCSLAVEHLENNRYNCTDMIEKPKKEEIMSHFSILGRVILPPEIFGILENTPKSSHSST